MKNYTYKDIILNKIKLSHNNNSIKYIPPNNYKTKQDNSKNKIFNNR